MRLLDIVLLLATALTAQTIAEPKIQEKVSYLEAGAIVDYTPEYRSLFKNDLRIYCYRGAPKTLSRVFESVVLLLEIADDDYTQYDGSTPAEVREHYDERRSLFSFSLFEQKRNRLQLSPFSEHCIGIVSEQPYRVRLQLLRVDFWRVIQLLVGVTLFIYAGQLSHNALFYYFTGVVLGICSSFLLLIWLSSKLMPRRSVMYGVLIGGWTIGIYIIQLLLENLQLIVLTYRTYVFWYIVLTGLISFFFCYRWGPPTNQRSKNIVKWLLQLMALVLIYYFSQFEEASVAVNIITIVLHYFPRSLLHKTRSMLLSRFPPKRRLLTSEEYYEQGVRETTKALDELRTFASSPDCKQWKVVSKLSNPLRFASFVEGASHLRDEEILSFESSHQVNPHDDSDISVEAEEDDQLGEVPRRPPSTSTYYINRSFRPPSTTSVQDNADLSEDDDEGHVIEVTTMSNSTQRYSRRTPNSMNSSRIVTPSSSSAAQNASFPALRATQSHEGLSAQRAISRTPPVPLMKRNGIRATARHVAEYDSDGY